MTNPVIVWFRQDLRLGDNPALDEAIKTRAPILPVYILNTETGYLPGAASRWWLHHSLSSLSSSLERKGACLLLRRGRPREHLMDIIRTSGASGLYFSCCYEPEERKLEEEIFSHLSTDVDFHRFSSHLLFEPETIHTKNGQPFRVFTPFWRACLRMPDPAAPLAAPEHISGYANPTGSDKLEDWNLLPVHPDWSEGFYNVWSPGEAGAIDGIDGFIQHGMLNYSHDRDRPDRPGTSRLSPHLHFGEITPRQVWHKVRANRHLPATRTGADAFLRQLGWREFCSHLLYHWPSLPTEPFRKEFRDFPWRNDTAMLIAWQKGLTGYPIVDAGMRELWHTGWMHNRVRMIAASFLVKDLLIHWQHGEAWFRDTLVDADLASNVGGWQWVAGCGADAAPYFRVFNPVLQGRKFDPQGRYIKKWIPELKNIPAKQLHAPWEASSNELLNAGVEAGRHYPQPVVDHAACRKRALGAYQQIKNRGPV